MPDRDVVLTPERYRALREGAVVVSGSQAVFRVEGNGALACLQGLLTNDLAKPGDGSLVYGALLTPKGMIVVDHWVLREADGFTLVGPAAGREATAAIFRRTLPPRLARAHDASDERRVLWALGPQAYATLSRAGLAPLPEACGRVAGLEVAGERVQLALGTESAYFAALAVGSPAAIDALADALAAAGAARGTGDDLEAARILAGWPALGAEIDERTLPQEVRYDELGGVSYTKGCYIGQETVARLHFRGHTNRELRGLRWTDGPPAPPAPAAGDEAGAGSERAVLRDEKTVGTIRSTLRIGDRTIGLAPIRREVAVGDVVLAGGAPATVVALPFSDAALGD